MNKLKLMTLSLALASTIAVSFTANTFAASPRPLDCKIPHGKNCDKGPDKKTPGTQDWCTCYIESARDECNKGCTVRSTDCDEKALDKNSILGVSLAYRICHQEYDAGYLPGHKDKNDPNYTTADDCIKDWQEYVDLRKSGTCSAPSA